MIKNHPAIKLVIIIEKVILDDVTDTVEGLGASGYTISPAGGKGSRGKRSSERSSISDANANVKIEVIVTDKILAETIAATVTEEYLSNYSGIIFLEQVEILRPEKFI